MDGGPRDVAGRLIGPAGKAHHSLQPAGPDQPDQRWAQGAVADEVSRWGHVEQGERLHKHVGGLVGAEPAGEGQPRRGQTRPRPGGQALHRRAPFAQPAAEAQPRRPRADRRPMSEEQVNPACRNPGLRCVVAARPGHLVVLAGHQRHERRQRPGRGPPRPPPCVRAPRPRARAGAQAGRQTWAPASTAGCAGSPVRSPGTRRRQSRNGRPAPPRRCRVTGQQGRRHVVPAQRRRQPQRRQLGPAGFQHAQHPNHPHPVAHPPARSPFSHPGTRPRPCRGGKTGQHRAPGKPAVTARRKTPSPDGSAPHCSRHAGPVPASSVKVDACSCQSGYTVSVFLRRAGSAGNADMR
jgi:hypothetical protein